jgi:hypothetical protein
MARGEDDPGDALGFALPIIYENQYPVSGLLTFETEYDAEEASASASRGNPAETLRKGPAPPASARPQAPDAGFQFSDFLGWLQRNSIYVVSSILACR